jgi:hypothetical protein
MSNVDVFSYVNAAALFALVCGLLAAMEKTRFRGLHDRGA